MTTQTEGPGPTRTLGAAEADVAGRAVFAWVLVPAAARMLHLIAEGDDPGQAVGDLRSAVGLLDRVGWPDDSSGPTPLGPADVAVVRAAARADLGHGRDPDRAAQRRVTRGRAPRDLSRHGRAAGLLAALDEGPA